MKRLGLWFLGMLFFFPWAYSAHGGSIPLVSSVGEARFVLEGDDRAADFKKAVRAALVDAVKKEAALLVENPEDLVALEGEIEDRIKDFVVKYQVLKAVFLLPGESEGESQRGAKGYGVWEVEVKAYIDSDLLQRSITGREPVEGG